MSVTITVLIDNLVHDQGLCGEHGLSFLVEREGENILFDTGQSGLFMKNARKLGLDLERTDTVVLSHGHYDHTGGLPALMAEKPDLRIIAHENAFKAKYGRGAEGARYIGIPLLTEDMKEVGIETVSGLHEVKPGIYAVTDIPRQTVAEHPENRFFLDEACTRPDLLEDDLSLAVETGEGLAVLLGCAHAGVSNILDEVLRHFPGRRIRAVLGGTHLISGDSSLLENTLHSLRKHNVELFRPGHCTGEKAMAFFMMQGFVRTDPLCTGANLILQS